MKSILDDLNNEELEQMKFCNWDERWIPEAAYFNWINAGMPTGRDEEFWYEAERQIVGGTVEEFAEMVQWAEMQSEWNRIRYN